MTSTPHNSSGNDLVDREPFVARLAPSAICALSSRSVLARAAGPMTRRMRWHLERERVGFASDSTRRRAAWATGVGAACRGPPFPSLGMRAPAMAGVGQMTYPRMPLGPTYRQTLPGTRPLTEGAVPRGAVERHDDGLVGRRDRGRSPATRCVTAGSTSRRRSPDRSRRPPRSRLARHRIPRRRPVPPWRIPSSSGPTASRARR